MIRRVTALVMIAVAGALVWIFLFAPPDRVSALFAHDDCRVVTVIDEISGQPVIGIEDLAQVSGGGRIVLAAHDRIDPALPSGGLYETSLFELNAGGDISVSSIVDLGTRTAPFRPHGIALSRDGARLAVINRVSRTEAQVEIGPYGADGWQVETRLQDRGLCRANDLSFAADGSIDLRITIDRGACKTSISDYMPGAQTGRVLSYTGAGLTEQAKDLTFPNGIAGVWVSETRSHRLTASDGREIALPGGPDNLNPGPDGALIAAVHPKLAQLGMYLNDWTGAAPSRVVRVEPDTGAVEVLFDDPAGEMFSAATSAVLIDGHMIAGSVRDAGLLLCEPGR